MMMVVVGGTCGVRVPPSCDCYNSVDVDMSSDVVTWYYFPTLRHTKFMEALDVQVQTAL